MREGTTSVTAADRPYGEFYDFYSVSPENFGSTLVLRWIFGKWDMGVWIGSSWLRIGTGGGHL
jgi:hypothetical protein